MSGKNGSKVRKGIVKVLVTVGLAATAALVGAPAASAAPTPPCPAGYYCFYEHAHYAGWHLNYNSTSEGDFGDPPSASGNRRNELSSIINNGNRTICVYDDHFWGANLIVHVQPYQDYVDLSQYKGVNDKADIWDVRGGDAVCPLVLR
ncbi:peptidase inhibitor family I36 protein [Amycolatopsis sp. NPDC051128]|uniref:peptidase inhibitor family I36 protein n=1 Tax=Amycolatopsis sp. NPDC051128 TaxID=3155412 RepID=UPI00341E81D1